MLLLINVFKNELRTLHLVNTEDIRRRHSIAVWQMSCKTIFHEISYIYATNLKILQKNMSMVYINLTLIIREYTRHTKDAVGKIRRQFVKLPLNKPVTPSRINMFLKVRLILMRPDIDV